MKTFLPDFEIISQCTAVHVRTIPLKTIGVGWGGDWKLFTLPLRDRFQLVLIPPLQDISIVLTIQYLL